MRSEWSVLLYLNRGFYSYQKSFSNMYNFILLNLSCEFNSWHTWNRIKNARLKYAPFLSSITEFNIRYSSGDLGFSWMKSLTNIVVTSHLHRQKMASLFSREFQHSRELEIEGNTPYYYVRIVEDAKQENLALVRVSPNSWTPPTKLSIHRPIMPLRNFCWKKKTRRDYKTKIDSN